MKTGKRLSTMLLALALLVGLVPAGMPVYAEDPSAASVVEVTDWAAFAASLTSENSWGKGNTYKLTKDLTLSGEIPVAMVFEGTFDGNGHTITLQNESYFASNIRFVSLGLFSALQGATVKNLNVGIEGDFYAGVNKDNFITNTPNVFYGVLAGRADAGTLISQCAVYAKGGRAAKFNVTVTKENNDDAYISAICGYASNSTIEQCYSDITLIGQRLNSNGRLGGGLLCGWADNGTAVTDCSLYYGAVIIRHPDPTLNDGKTVLAAPAVAYATSNSSIRNIIERWLTCMSFDIDESNVQYPDSNDPIYLTAVRGGKMGLVYALGDNSAVLDKCYYKDLGFSSSNAINTSATGDLTDAAAYLPGAKPTVWTIADNGFVALKWMLDSVQLSLKESDPGTTRDVAVDVTPQAPLTKNDLLYSVKANVMGREATPSITSVARATTTSVSQIALAYAGGTEPTYYAGGTYGFTATVSGTNVPQTAAVTWKALNASNTELADAVTDGALAIPSNYTGDLTLTASYGGKQVSKQITVQSPIAMASDAPASVKAGTQAAFSADVHYFGSTTPDVTWSVTGGKATISNAEGSKGILTVPADETATSLTVTAALASGLSARQTVAVSAADPADTTSPLSLTLSAGQTSAASTAVTAKANEPLYLSLSAGSVTPPSTYYTDSFAITGATAPAYTGSLADGFVFSAAGTAKVSVARAYYSTATPAEGEKPLDVWYASAQVTVTAAQTLTPATLSLAQADSAAGAKVNASVAMRRGQSLTLKPAALTAVQADTVDGYTAGDIAFDVPAEASAYVDTTTAGQITFKPTAALTASSVTFTVARPYTKTVTSGTPPTSTTSTITFYGTIKVILSGNGTQALEMTETSYDNTPLSLQSGESVTLVPALTAAQTAELTGYTAGSLSFNYAEALATMVDVATAGQLKFTPAANLAGKSENFSFSVTYTNTTDNKKTKTFYGSVDISVLGTQAGLTLTGGSAAALKPQTALVTVGSSLTMQMPAAENYASYEDRVDIPDATQSGNYSAYVDVTGGSGKLTTIAFATQKTGASDAPAGTVNFTLRRFYKDASGNRVASYYGAVTVTVRTAQTAPTPLAVTYAQETPTAAGGVQFDASNATKAYYTITLPDENSTVLTTAAGGTVKRTYRYALSSTLDSKAPAMAAVTGNTITGTVDSSATAAGDDIAFGNLEAGKNVYLWLVGDAGDTVPNSGDPYPAVADSTPVVFLLHYDATAGGTVVSSAQTSTTSYPAEIGYTSRTVEFSRQTFANADTLASVRAFLSAYCENNNNQYWRGKDSTAPFPPLASGSVVVTVSTKSRLPDASYSETTAVSTRSVTQTLTLDNVTPMPLISARNASGLLENTFTIDVPAGTSVYYSMLGLSKIDDPVSTDQYPTDKTGELYTAGTKIPVKVTAAADQQIVAMAIAYKEGVASDVDLVRFNVSELAQPLAPGLTIDGKAFTATRAYEDKLPFGFTHDVLTISATGNKVYYTTNGLEPQPGATTNGTQLYDPNGTEPVLNFGTETSYVITAVIVDAATGRVSSSRRYEVHAITQIDAPQPSVKNGTAVASGSELYLGLTDDVCKRIQGYLEVRNGAAYHAQAIADYKAAVAAGQAPAEVPEYAGYTLADNSAEPIDGVQYLIVKTLPSQTVLTLPQIKYLLGGNAADIDAKGSVLQLAVCQIYDGVDSSGAAVMYARFVNPASISLSGTAGTAIAIHTKTLAADGSMKDSATESLSYTIRSTAKAPTSYPETAPAVKDVKALSGGDVVSLLCDAGCEIYYTDDGTIPAVAWDRWTNQWQAQNTTQKYTQPIKIPAGNTALVTINAVSVSTANLLDVSARASFIYQPPSAVQAVYATVASETAVVDGAKVELLCGTANAKIFYKTYAAKPADTDIPEPYKDTSYSGAIPISQEVWIRAIATLDGVTSVPATYHYTVASKLSAPTASLPGGSVINKGTRILLSGAGTIAYTLDGSDPTDAASAVQYGTSVVLDGDYGTAVTLRAYALQNGYTPSDVTSFTYTVCEKDGYIAASPAGGSTIASGTAITLTSALTGGQIFYTLDGSTPQVTNTYAAGSGKAYSDYEWTAGANTYAGNTVTLSGSPDGTSTIRVLAMANGADVGDTRTFVYTFRPQAGAPTASIPTGAVVLDGATVTLTAKEGSIYYTTDGTAPTTSSALYAQPIDVSSGMTLRAYAVADGKEPSSVITCVYTRAGTAAAPVFSEEPGAIAQGTYVTITSRTAGASIYYSLDGTEPTADNLSTLTLYSSPIQITRGVTIKAIAALSTLHPSNVSTAQYTVVQPAPEPTAPTEPTLPQTTQTDRLQSRRTYASENNGPTYSDVMLTDTTTNTVVTAPTGSLQSGLQLIVERVNANSGDIAAVRSTLGNEITAAYNVELRKNGDIVQPSGNIEIGFAIPTQYQNAVVEVARINDDGTATTLSTRRAGGMAYVVTNHLSKYVLTVPAKAIGASGRNLTTPILLIVAAVAAAALLIFLIWRSRRRAAAELEQEMPESPQPFDFSESPYDDSAGGGQNGTPQ